jgi:hypothetical protein
MLAAFLCTEQGATCSGVHENLILPTLILALTG